MIFIMNTEVFFDIYLQDEEYKDILDAQYICVSSKIYRRDNEFKNIVIDHIRFFPSSGVLNQGTFEDMKEEYYNQLDEEMPYTFMASLIKASIEENYNIILLCTKKEWKLKYLKWLSNFVYMEFGYPIYDYKDFYNGCGLIDYDREKVLKKVSKIVKDAEKRLYDEERKTKSGRNKIMQRYKNMKKSELKKILKEQDLYSEDMTKDEMLDMLEAFL